jgi:hypothetical protein
MKNTLIVLVSMAVIAVGNEATTFQFEKDPHVIANGRSPKFAARRSHGLMTIFTVPVAGGSGADLFFASSADVGDSFTAPQRINNVPGEVSDHGENSAELLVSPDESTLYAVWNTRDPQNPAGSHLRSSRSTAMTPSWSPAVTIDDDSQAVSHSFQGAFVAPDGTIYAAWLDAREGQGERGIGHTGGAASVYLARSRDGGKTFEKNVRVAGNICPCCRVSLGAAGKRIVVAWRQVGAGDVRDIYAASSSDQGATWSKPVLVGRDGWKIKGCPHVGPSLAALGNTLYVAWFSEGGGKPAVYVSSTTNGGESFAPKRVLSDGTFDPTHPFLTANEDKLAVVFQARDASRDAGWGKIGVYYREIYSDGSLSKLVRAGEGKVGASFPSVTLGLSGRIFVGWTEASEGVAQAYLVRGRSIGEISPIARRSSR